MRLVGTHGSSQGPHLPGRVAHEVAQRQTKGQPEQGHACQRVTDTLTEMSTEKGGLIIRKCAKSRKQIRD